MKKAGFVKGMSIGLIAGAAVVIACKQVMSSNRTLAKKAGKAMRAASDIMEDIHNFLCQSDAYGGDPHRHT